MRTVIVTSLAVVFATAAGGQVILQPTDVVVNTLGDQPGFETELLIDQSGLSAGYESGSTPFVEYVASTSHSGSSGFWNSSAFATEGTIVFDMGELYALDGLALWQHSNFFGQAIEHLSIRVDADGDFSIGASEVGSFGPLPENDLGATVFNFTPVLGRFVELTLDNYGNGFGTRAGEVALSGFEVPIVQPAAIVANSMGELAGFEAVRLIDQSGLSLVYVSGVTSFESFTSTVHFNDGYWNSAAFATEGTMVFDLGEVMQVHAMALWQHSNFFNQSLEGVTLRADVDGDLSTGAISLGTFEPLQTNLTSALTLEFEPVVARFIEVAMHNYGNGFGTRANELAFAAIALPACSNGIDDDGDGLVDFGSDPQCLAPDDGREAPNPQCGLGVELAGVLCLLGLAGPARNRSSTARDRSVAAPGP